MVTMIDEIFDRNYQRCDEPELNASSGEPALHIAGCCLNAFDVLNRIEYQAPWTARPKRAR